MIRLLQSIMHPVRPEQYYAIRDDGVLALYEDGGCEPIKEYAAQPGLLVYEGFEDNAADDMVNGESGKQQANNSLPYGKSYTMELIWPWLSVFQQYGTNGCVYQLETEEVTHLSRENYYSEISTFANGLLLYGGHFCILHQTKWNRLDITDLEDGRLLTDREIYYRTLEQSRGRGRVKHEKKNYVDYFHGKITFSPDYRYFLDAGWEWQPAGVPVLYSVDAFVADFENSGIKLKCQDEYLYTDEWDQSAVWLDRDVFLLNHCPAPALIEEGGIFYGKTQQVLLQFDVTQRTESGSVYYREELQAMKILPFPFVPSMVQPGQQMLNVDLYWDEEEQLLIGMNGSDILVCDQAGGVGYCMRYGMGRCYYCVQQHQVYQLSSWMGDYKHEPVRTLLQRGRGFCMMPIGEEEKE